MKMMHMGFAWIAASVLGVAVAQDQPQQDAQRLQQQQRQQQPTQQGDQNPRGVGQNRQAAAGMGLDSHVANCLMLGNQEEIVLLKMGSEKTENSEIKQAAEQMIQEHQQFIQQLQPHASIQAMELNKWLSAEGDGTDRERNRDQASATGATSAPGQATILPGQRRGTPAQVVSNPGQTGQSGDDLTMQLMELEKKVAKECIRLNKEAMQDKQGAEFDKAFLASQVSAHMGMLAKLNASEEAVSGELQQLIKKGQETTKQHKEKLVSLMKEMKDDSNTNEDSRANTNRTNTNR